MTVAVRPVDFDRDRPALLDLLERTRAFGPGYPLAARYDWMYLSNPHGQAAGWLAAEEESGEPVGFTVALPREMSVCGRRTVAWNCADFSIDPRFRTLGIAAQLRRQAREAVDAGDPPFLYAHPNSRMLAVHRRVGHTVIGQFHRFARLVRPERKVAPPGWLRPCVKAVLVAAGQAWSALDRARLAGSRYELRRERNPEFSRGFTELSRRLEAACQVCGVRDERYLTWRYSENPLYRVEAVTARRGGELAGYILYAPGEDSVTIKDLVALERDSLREMLLFLALELWRSASCGSLSVNLPAWSDYLEVLGKLGFRKRPDSTSSVVVHAAPDFELRDVVLDCSRWFMTVGDRDV